MKTLATVAVAVVMTAVSGFSAAGDLHKAKAEMLTKSINGYKWSNTKTIKKPSESASVNSSASAFKWAGHSQAGQSAEPGKVRIEVQTASTSKVQGFKWGIRSTAEQQGFKWGIR